MKRESDDFMATRPFATRPLNALMDRLLLSNSFVRRIGISILSLKSLASTLGFPNSRMNSWKLGE